MSVFFASSSHIGILAFCKEFSMEVALASFSVDVGG
jgi:hypothetical protein